MTVEKIEAYRTTDGQIFVDRAEVDNIKEIVKVYNETR